MRGLETGREQNEEEAWRERKWRGGGMLNQRGERDAAIRTAKRKWGCQDKDKLRQREGD